MSSAHYLKRAKMFLKDSFIEPEFSVDVEFGSDSYNQEHTIPVLVVKAKDTKGNQKIIIRTAVSTENKTSFYLIFPGGRIINKSIPPDGADDPFEVLCEYVDMYKKCAVLA